MYAMNDAVGALVGVLVVCAVYGVVYLFATPRIRAWFHR
jgi:hypothetical protein